MPLPVVATGTEPAALLDVGTGVEIPAPWLGGAEERATGELLGVGAGIGVLTWV